jgi:RNA polymerase sigma-70 factor, ECF subfamily
MGFRGDMFRRGTHLRLRGGVNMHAISAADLTRMIALARSGSGEALGQLLELYRGYLRLIAGLQIGQNLQSKVSPSDLIQATFLQASRGFADFNGNSEGELMSWLRKILASQLAMELRRYATERRNIKLERRMHVEVDQSSAALDFLAARGRTPSQSTMRRERAVLLADALTKLPEDYRNIIVQRHLQNRSFADIADVTHRSVDSVKSAWRRAIIKLRESLGDGAL